MKREKLVNQEIYHVYNKSIAQFKIFNHANDFERFRRMLLFFQKETKIRYSFFIEREMGESEDFYLAYNNQFQQQPRTVDLLAYCIMPTHIHLLLRQIQSDGISKLMQKIENSYAKYFNLVHKRKGPLWEGPFQTTRCESDEQLLHLTRYIHLNPTTAYLVSNPRDWEYSSYAEYVGEGISSHKKICTLENNAVMPMTLDQYAMFVEAGIEYQRSIALTTKSQDRK